MSERSWSFEISGVPGVKERARAEGGRVRPRSTGKGRRFELLVAGAAIEAGVRWLEGFVFEVQVGIWLPDFRVKDGDNVIKAVLDGLQKAGAACLPGDDLFRVPRQTPFLGGVDRAHPRIKVEILRRRARGAEAGSPDRKLYEATRK